MASLIVFTWSLICANSSTTSMWLETSCAVLVEEEFADELVFTSEIAWTPRFLGASNAPPLLSIVLSKCYRSADRRTSILSGCPIGGGTQEGNDRRRPVK